MKLIASEFKHMTRLVARLLLFNARWVQALCTDHERRSLRFAQLIACSPNIAPHWALSTSPLRCDKNHNKSRLHFGFCTVSSPSHKTTIQLITFAWSNCIVTASLKHIANWREFHGHSLFIADNSLAFTTVGTCDIIVRIDSYNSTVCEDCCLFVFVIVLILYLSVVQQLQLLLTWRYRHQSTNSTMIYSTSFHKMTRKPTCFTRRSAFCPHFRWYWWALVIQRNLNCTRASNWAS